MLSRNAPIHRICDRMIDRYIYTLRHYVVAKGIYVPATAMKRILLKVLILMLSEEQILIFVDYKCDG